MRRPFALLLAFGALRALAADESPLLDAAQTQKAKELSQMSRSLFSELAALESLPPTTRRADVRKQSGALATKRLEAIDRALDKEISALKTKFAKSKPDAVPTLVLVPDIHTSEADRKIVSGLVDASPSDHLVGLEGLSLGWKDGPVDVAMSHGRTVRLPSGARVTGIEMPDFVATEGPHQIVDKLKGAEKQRAEGRKLVLQTLVLGYGDDFLAVPSGDRRLSKSMERYLDPLKAKDLTTVALAVEKGAKDIPPDAEWVSLATVIWARGCRQYYGNSVLAPEVKRLVESLEKNPEDAAAHALLWDLIGFELRNLSWAAVVSSVYAKVAARDETLYVVMGAHHVPPMQRYLTEVLGQHGVKVTTRYRKSHLEQLEKIAKASEDEIQTMLKVFPE